MLDAVSLYARSTRTSDSCCFSPRIHCLSPDSRSTSPRTINVESLIIHSNPGSVLPTQASAAVGIARRTKNTGMSRMLFSTSTLVGSIERFKFSANGFWTSLLSTYAGRVLASDIATQVGPFARIPGVPQGQWLTGVLGVIPIVTAGRLRKKSSDARFVKWRLDWD